MAESTQVPTRPSRDQVSPELVKTRSPERIASRSRRGSRQVRDKSAESSLTQPILRTLSSMAWELHELIQHDRCLVSGTHTKVGLIYENFVKGQPSLETLWNDFRWLKIGYAFLKCAEIIYVVKYSSLLHWSVQVSQDQRRHTQSKWSKLIKNRTTKVVATVGNYEEVIVA